MTELLRFLNAYETWIYVLLGAVGLLYLRKFILSLQEWRGALFGLERNLAQRHFSEATSILILLILLGAGEFSLVTFVTPSFPNVQPLPTPTLDFLATPTTVLAAEPGTPPVGESQQTVAATAMIVSSQNGCVPGELEFTSPKAGEELKGKITLTGTVRTQSFSYYKYEFSAQTGGENNWTTIQAGDQIKCKECSAENDPNPLDDILGDWDTSQLPPGEYLLRLVVFDNQGQPLPACEMPIKIAAEESTP